ncbi:MAG: hypothetical protein PVH62_04785 [Anaerolineae bacterium]|jgi:gas vesicle protein
MRKTVGFLAGMICGVVVGSVAGLLLAPFAGPELQSRVRSRVQDLLEEGRLAAAAKRAELETQLEAFSHGEPVVLQQSSGSPEG